MIILNNEYEVLTDCGWKDFDGISENETTELISISTKTSVIKCTKNHQIKTKDGWKYAVDIKHSDLIKTEFEWESPLIIKSYEETTKVYDLVNVKDTKSFYANDILVHNCLYIDECAFIQKNTWEDFWASVYPTVSSSKTSKIFMSTTPYGMNHFYKLWMDAINDINGFDFHEVSWNRVPGRDEEWKAQTIRELGGATGGGQERFDAEYDLKFLGSGGTLISGTSLRNLVYVEPDLIQFDEKFKIFKSPDPEREYVLSCDYGEGLLQDSSTIQVIDITDDIWDQVATYCDNEIKPREFALVKNKIGIFYNTGLIVGENNSIGNDSLEELNDEYEYDNIFLGDDKGDKFGIRMTTKSKRIGCSYLKSNIEDQKLIINDFETIQQLSTYIKKGKSYNADEGHNDDLVTPLILLSYFMNNKLWVDDWIDKTVTNNKETIARIEDDLLPIGFVFDGDEIMSLGDDSDF